MQDNFEKIIRDNVKSTIDPKGRGNAKSLTKALAKVASQLYIDAIHEEILPSISSCSLKEISAVWGQIRDLKNVIELSDDLILDEILKRKDLMEINHYFIDWFLYGASDDRLITYLNQLINDPKFSNKKIEEKIDENIVKRVSEFKNLKEHENIINLISKYIALKFKGFNFDDKNSNSLYFVERMIPSIAVFANYNEDVKKFFEKIYLHYLENKDIKFTYNQKTYVSVLCRALRAYKNKEFRNVLIKKLVVIKIPSLQKRMAREFSKARRYLNLA